MNTKKVLGIIGGMGSPAAADTFQRLVEMQDAPTDQDFLEIVIHNNPHVPDRTARIVDDGPSPLTELLRSVEVCNQAGADFIIIACMSAHHYVEEMQAVSRAEIIDGIAETVSYIRTALPDVKRVGVLATTGNLRCGLYQRHLEEAGLTPVLLDDDEQQHLMMDAVYAPWGVKAGHTGEKPRATMREAAKRLHELGAEAIIAGCTEVQVVLAPADVEVPMISSVDVLCRVGLERCGVAVD